MYTSGIDQRGGGYVRERYCQDMHARTSGLVSPGPRGKSPLADRPAVALVGGIAEITLKRPTGENHACTATCPCSAVRCLRQRSPPPIGVRGVDDEDLHVFYRDRRPD